MSSERRPYLVAVVGVRPQYIRLQALRALHAAEGLPDLWALDSGQHPDKEMRADAADVVAVDPSMRGWPPSLVVRRAMSIHGSDIMGAMGVLVMGDANPTVVGAALSLETGLPLVHIEAGARRDPDEPEDRNSRVAAAIARLSCAVTQGNLDSLTTEGYGRRAVVTGDLAWPWFAEKYAGLLRQTAAGQKSGPGVLVSIHRPFNSDPESLRNLVDLLSRASLPATWVVHPRNARVIRSLVEARRSKIRLVQPLGHSEAVHAVAGCEVLLTDSGGLIREAHYLRRPAGVLRRVGGWPELMNVGANQLLGYARDLTLDQFEGFIGKCRAQGYPQVSLFRPEKGPSDYRAAMKEIFR